MTRGTLDSGRFALLAQVALAAILANQFAAVSAAHSHADRWDVRESSLSEGLPTLPAPLAVGHDPLHCEGCSSRADVQKRVPDTARADARFGTARQQQLPPEEPVWLRGARVAGRRPARGPPTPS